MRQSWEVPVDEIVNEFHELYYNVSEQTWTNTRWLGVPALKCPLDLWVYQEILYEIRPDVIVETGTHKGGTALFFASMCDLLGAGRIVTIDIDRAPEMPEHPRITYLEGSSVSDEIVARVREFLSDGDRVVVILDSDHSKDHVLAEMRVYAEMVTLGSYLIVEDTNVNGHPILPRHGPGPMEAVEEFVRSRSDFIIDRDREKFFMTFNPKGYLRRVAERQDARVSPTEAVS